MKTKINKNKKIIGIVGVITGLLIIAFFAVNTPQENINKEKYNFCEKFYKSNKLIDSLSIECKQPNILERKIIQNQINNCQSVDKSKIN